MSKLFVLGFVVVISVLSLLKAPKSITFYDGDVWNGGGSECYWQEDFGPKAMCYDRTVKGNIYWINLPESVQVQIERSF